MGDHQRKVTIGDLAERTALEEIVSPKVAEECQKLFRRLDEALADAMRHSFDEWDEANQPLLRRVRVDVLLSASTGRHGCVHALKRLHFDGKPIVLYRTEESEAEDDGKLPYRVLSEVDLDALLNELRRAVGLGVVVEAGPEEEAGDLIDFGPFSALDAEAKSLRFLKSNRVLSVSSRTTHASVERLETGSYVLYRSLIGETGPTTDCERIHQDLMEEIRIRAASMRKDRADVLLVYAGEARNVGLALDKDGNFVSKKDGPTRNGPMEEVRGEEALPHFLGTADLVVQKALGLDIKANQLQRNL